MLALVTALSLVSCKKASEGYVTGGELVVVQDYSDIKLGIYGIDTLNPVATKSESVQKIMNIVHEPLFTFDENGKADPVLAHTFSVANGGTQISIKIKNGVKWHDGTVFTAEDVVYTLSRMKESGGLYSKISSKISSFTAPDKNSVIINFESGEIAPEYLLTFPIIPKHIAYSEGAEYVPVGTGGYKFVSKGGTEILLEPNTRWHEGAVSERKVIVKILKDKNAVAEAFNVGEIDAITSDELSGGTVTPKANSNTKKIVSGKMVFLGFNTKSQVMEPVSVRKAIGKILDKKKIVEQDAYGQGVVAELSVDPTSWVMSGEKKEQTEDTAEDIMEYDGYSIKDGIYQKDGNKVTLRLLVNEDNSQRTALAESIASALTTAGFEVVTVKTSFSDYNAKIAADDFDMFLGETEVSRNLNPEAMLSSENYFNFNTEQINAAVAELYDVKDDELKKRIAGFSRIFYSNPPYIPLYFKTESVIYGSYVSGVENPVETDPYKGIEKWYFYDKDGNESKEQADE